MRTPPSTPIDAAAVTARAAALVGTRFRLHGRDPRYGLDCVGLVAACLETAGVRVAAPTGYALRGGRLETFDAAFARGGLARLDPARPVPGSVALARIRGVQWHLALAVENGAFIHADAGLRRVALTPPPAPWPIIRIYGDASWQP